MRKLSIGIIFLILVSGCGRTEDAQNLPATPSHGPIKPVVPTLTDLPNGPEAENRFISTLQRAGIRFADRDKTITMGRTVCASLQTNAVLGVTANTQSLDHISDRLTKGTEFTADQSGVIIGASIGAFCPEFSYLGN
ncbi:DUF732 domain-containing protein [Nocardia sp. CDC160]|uniref:DUF732 domain-containing protein n=1 Tax=Nocardia sp. CDC160 TaxID=3112166 RepID=UPI002DBD536E|nr:DUF732 domain-containing protein [Nocardia sp. CDC160]MEC3918051.1 DUF732 domain-containing protein [Nocardia sp. CDC160]